MQPALQEAPAPERSLAPLPKRLIDVFVSPGRLMDALARDPRWLGALLASAFLVGLQMSLIPSEVFVEVQRRAALQAGREVPEFTEQTVRMIAIATPVVATVATAAFSFLFAGVYAVIFSFVLGDEGSYRQHLAAVTHAWFIPAVVGLLLTPLRISASDPQLSLNMGSFAFFLPEGYVANVLRLLDLTQIWASLVVARGIHAIDSRRSFGSAAAILLVLLLALALVLGRFIPA